MTKVIPFYEKGNIPMISEKKGCEKIVSLFKKNSKLREIPVERRSSETAKLKLKEMERELEQTFPLWAANAEKTMDPEDLEFLKSMKGDRTASFGSRDHKLATQIKRKQVRKLKKQKGISSLNVKLKSLLPEFSLPAVKKVAVMLVVL